jgi:polyisoprenoid-binding protein YceI
MLKKILVLLLLTTSMVSSQEWIQNKNKTSVLFQIRNFGITVDGGFKTTDIKTNLDTKDLSNSYINATITVNSIFTGIEARDKHLLETDYFDTLNHEKIILKSSKLTKDANGNITLFAKLSIKGITKEMEIPLDVFEDNSMLTLKASMLVNRKNFNVGGRSILLSNNVKIKVEYSATK